MRRLLTVSLAAACLAAAAPTVFAGGPNDVEALTDEARGAVKGLAQGLQKELKAALDEGGPVKAIDVCKTVAPGIAAEQSKARDMQVGRTALRVRNPKNAPDDYERKAMEDFLAAIAEGKDPMKLEKAEIVTGEDGGKTFRYMKAIPTAEKPCLACHGETIAPEVKAAIDDMYPEDQATGFKAGELRGAFTIQKKL